MNVARKKSTTSQSSFVVLDESQDSIKPKSACSIGCDPIFEWKDYRDSSTTCDISIPVDDADLDASSNDEKENQTLGFWKRAVAVREKLTDVLNESADEKRFRAFDLAQKTTENQKKWDRFYMNAERARMEREEAGGDEEETEETAEEQERLIEEEESDDAEEDEDEEEEHEESNYQRSNDSDDQESE